MVLFSQDPSCRLDFWTLPASPPPSPVQKSSFLTLHQTRHFRLRIISSALTYVQCLLLPLFLPHEQVLLSVGIPAFLRGLVTVLKITTNQLSSATRDVTTLGNPRGSPPSLKHGCGSMVWSPSFGVEFAVSETVDFFFGKFASISRVSRCGRNCTRLAVHAGTQRTEELPEQGSALCSRFCSTNVVVRHHTHTHTHTEREREKEKHTQTETDRQTKRQRPHTGTCTDTDTCMHRDTDMGTHMYTHAHTHTHTLTSLTMQDCGQVLPGGGSRHTHTQPDVPAPAELWAGPPSRWVTHTHTA